MGRYMAHYEYRLSDNTSNNCGNNVLLNINLIQAFKLLKCLDQINYNNFFVLDVNTSRRRSHIESC